jgi:type VI secretion system protein ImpL
VIGQPGSGRSSLVAAALLEGAGTVREAGGARFILAEEAVLIEMATSIPVQGAEQDTWTGLFRLLAKARPRRPVDAIVLAEPIGEMFDAGPTAGGGGAGRGLGAAVVARVRLQQAMRALGTRPPLYVAVTQCDRLLGFAAGLDGLDEASALGAAVPHGKDPAQAVQDGLNDLASVLGRRLPHRLASERDVARRAQAGELPAQITQLAQGCARFVRDLMRSGVGDQVLDLRGLYLTAAGGDRGTGIDGWQAGFGEMFRLRTPDIVPATSPPTFAPGLMRGLVLADAGTGGSNAQLERRTQRRSMAGYAVCLGVLGLLLMLWDASFVANERRLDSLDEQATLLTRFSQSEGETPYAFEKVLPMLNVAAAAAVQPPQSPITHLLTATLLPPTDGRDAANDAYNRALSDRLLPALRELMVRQMRNTQDLTQLRELLRLYLESGSPSQWKPSAFDAWAQTSLVSALPFNPAIQAALRTHVARLLPLMPVPSGLDQGAIASARERLRRVPHPEQIYARLRALAASSPDAPAIDVEASLGAAGAQLLMMRPQAGLPSIVPGFYTKAGFYNIFLRRLPTMLHSAADDVFVMGPSSDETQSKAEMQGVADLYVRDYIQQWRAVVDQIGLQALPDLPSLVGGLQALSSPDSPLQQLVDLVRVNTDLGLPTGADAAGLLARIAGPVVGNAAVQAATAAATSAATSASGELVLPAGLTEWPGTNIRTAFLPIIGLSGAGSQASPMRLQGTLVQAYGVVSGIASAPNPQGAALQAAAAAISGQGADALAALRTQAVGLPKPLDGIYRDLYNAIWNVLLQMSLDRITATWASDVAPVCSQSISRRYPFSDADAVADRDVLPKDFGAFFGPSGVVDKWLSTYLMPFVVPGADGQFTMATRGTLRLDLSREGLAQINRARTFRELFFDAAGNLAVRMSVVPRYLDPRAFSATLQVNDLRATYRHEPPRAMELRWSGMDEGGTASVQMSLTDGSAPQVAASGPWALFRLLDQAERMDGTDGLVVAYTMSDARVAYQIKAASVSNPIVNKDWRSFRCVPRL